MSSKVISGDDYPEHLNPFDDNYNGVVALPPSSSRHKYNTWSSGRPHQVTLVKKQKPAFLEKPWAALNISPKGKIVRRLSILKTAVERFASKNKKRLEHSSSCRESNLPPRSNSLHDEFNFRIISPKLKEKIRQQAFSRSISKEEHDKRDFMEKNSTSPQLDGRLALPLKLDADCQAENDDSSPTSPESEKTISYLGARPKTRKKRPPPPPPVGAFKQVNLDIVNGQERSEDTLSANSSITQDLEKDASTDDDNSLAELDQQGAKHEAKHC